MAYIGNEPIVSATRTVTEITATAGQTTFTANGGYTVGYIDVFVNGAQLQTSDFTASNGSSITLTEAAQAGDVIRLVAWGTFATSTHVLKAGDTMSGGLNVLGNLGVGTSSPAVSIDARKASDVQIRAFETGLGVDTRVVSVGGAGQAGIIGTYSNHPLVVYTNGVERARYDTSGNFLMNSGYGSAATAYGCRAWVNFNGTGTVAIRASGNVSSITDNGVGDYTVNFTNAMPDANYSVVGTAQQNTFANADCGSVSTHRVSGAGALTTTSVRLDTTNTATTTGNPQDMLSVQIAIFR